MGVVTFARRRIKVINYRNGKKKSAGEDKKKKTLNGISRYRLCSFLGVILARFEASDSTAALCFRCTYYAVHHLDVNAVGRPLTRTSFELRRGSGQTALCCLTFCWLLSARPTARGAGGLRTPVHARARPCTHAHTHSCTLQMQVRHDAKREAVLLKKKCYRTRSQFDANT